MALLLCLPVNAWSQASTDEELYTRACAACHGADGGGRSVEDVGFDTPLPDFTDCEFTSREPDPDWYAVIHQGGPVRAFDRMMPAFGTALASHEIDAILRHVRTFCSNDAWPRGEFNLPRPLFTEKAFPEDEIVVTTAVGTGSPGTVETEFLYEKRFGPTGMLEIALPAGWRGTADAGASAAAAAGSAFGLADLAIGWKQTMHHNLQRGSIFSVGGEVVLAADGPGGLTDRRVIAEPYAAYGHLLPHDAFIQVQALAELMGDRSRADAHGLPGGDRIRCQPHGDIASLDQRSVVCRPVSDVVFCLVLRVHSRFHSKIIHLPSLRWPGCRSWLTEGAGSVHQRRDSPEDPPAVLGGREDTDSPQGLAGRREPRGAVPSRRAEPESLRPVEQGVSRSWEEAAGRRHDPRGDVDGSDRPAIREWPAHARGGRAGP